MRDSSRSKRSSFPSPMVMRDIEEYRSPIDGKVISSRSAKREDLKASGCVEYEPTKGHRKGYENPEFLRKHKDVHISQMNEIGLERIEKARKEKHGR